MHTHTAEPPAVEPEDLIARFITACTDAGLTAVAINPKSKVRVSAPKGDGRMGDTLLLARDMDAIYRWYWSWGEPMLSPDTGQPLYGHDLDQVVRVVKPVVTHVAGAAQTQATTERDAAQEGATAS